MMSLNWKRYVVIVFDIAIAAYLILAFTVLNKPAEKAAVCSEVKIDIAEDIAEGFLNADEIKKLLERSHDYPLGQPMSEISARKIEETLQKNPFVEQAECYKTQSGHVCINLRQRMPVVHVMANNGDNYYVDTHGAIMPETRTAANMVVATGWISRRYAQKSLARMANLIIEDPYWQNQIVQINILPDGSVEIVPRVGDHIVYLGAPVRVGEKLERLRKFYLYGLNQAGWNKYSYINLEFSNQIICKKREIKK